MAKASPRQSLLVGEIGVQGHRRALPPLRELASVRIARKREQADVAVIGFPSWTGLYSELDDHTWPQSILVSSIDAQKYQRMVYNHCMRTNIDIDESLVRQARKLTRLKTKRQIVDKALELLVRSESRKGILRYYGSGNWKGDPKALRRNRV